MATDRLKYDPKEGKWREDKKPSPKKKATTTKETATSTEAGNSKTKKS